METPRKPALNTGAPPSSTKKRQPRSPTQKLKEFLDCIKLQTGRYPNSSCWNLSQPHLGLISAIQQTVLCNPVQT